MIDLERKLPEGWTWQPLKHVTTRLSRGTAPEYVDDGPVHAVSQAVNQEHGLDWSRGKFHGYSGDPKNLKGYLERRDILINSTGTGTLGRIGFFDGSPDSRPCVADGHVTVARTRSDMVDPRFAYYWMGSSSFYNLIYSVLTVGSTNQIELSRERLANSPVPVPILEEQRRIADFLDGEAARIDKIIKLRGQQIKLLKSRGQSLRDAEIEGLFKRFGSVPLRRLIVSIEQGVSPQCEDTPAEENEWGILKLSSVKHGTFDSRENKRIPEGAVPAVRYEVHEGDLLVTRANTPDLVGDVAVADEPPDYRILPDLIYRVNLTSNVSPHLISEVALSSRLRGLIQASARGSSQSMVKIRGEDIKDWPIPCSDADSQFRIAQIMCEFADDFNCMNNSLNAQVSLLSERRQALITAAVTGQIDVTTARGADVA